MSQGQPGFEGGSCCTGVLYCSRGPVSEGNRRRGSRTRQDNPLVWFLGLPSPHETDRILRRRVTLINSSYYCSTVGERICLTFEAYSWRVPSALIPCSAHSCFQNSLPTATFKITSENRDDIKHIRANSERIAIE